MHSLSRDNKFSLFIENNKYYSKPKNIYKIYNSFNTMIEEVDLFITLGTKFCRYLIKNYNKVKRKYIKKTIPII